MFFTRLSSTWHSLLSSYNLILLQSTYHVPLIVMRIRMHTLVLIIAMRVVVVEAEVEEVCFVKGVQIIA